MSCRRCGFCCMSLPNWDDLTENEKVTIRIHDKEAEELFKQVIDARCPNLVVNRKGKYLTSCKIYNKRYNFCKALKPNSEQCKLARK